MQQDRFWRGLALGIMGIVWLSTSACVRETRESPYNRRYFIGTWDYREAYFQSWDRVSHYVEVNGFVRFNGGLSTSNYFKGNFELSYRDTKFDTTFTYNGNFIWRVEGTDLVVVMEGYEDQPLYPALGVAGGAKAKFFIDTRKRFRENFILLSVDVTKKTGPRSWRAIFLERRT